MATCRDAIAADCERDRYDQRTSAASRAEDRQWVCASAPLRRTPAGRIQQPTIPRKPIIKAPSSFVGPLAVTTLWRVRCRGLFFFPGTTSRNDAEVVTVSSGAIRDAIEIRNYGGPLGFSVQGRLVPPQTGAVVRTIVGGGFNAEAVAGPDGSFILSDLPSGSHSLEPRLASPSAVPGGMRCSTVCGRILRQRMFSFLLPREVVRGPFVRLSSAP
jgi:hypothetical protein